MATKENRDAWAEHVENWAFRQRTKSGDVLLSPPKPEKVESSSTRFPGTPGGGGGCSLYDDDRLWFTKEESALKPEKPSPVGLDELLIDSSVLLTLLAL